MNKTSLTLVILFLLLQKISSASVKVDPLITKCHITPKINLTEYIPKEFNNNNNLRRYTHSMQTAKGNKIIIAGRVMDKNCVPIMGAVLKVWQKNNFGVYQNKNLNSKFNDPNFVGTGTSYTDNFGRFSFVTILPGASKNSFPSINIKINHEKLHSLTTKIFLNYDNKEYTYDSILKNLDKVNAQRLIAQSSKNDQNDEEKIYYIDLVLNDVLQNKSY